MQIISGSQIGTEKQGSAKTEASFAADGRRRVVAWTDMSRWLELLWQKSFVNIFNVKLSRVDPLGLRVSSVNLFDFMQVVG